MRKILILGSFCLLFWGSGVLPCTSSSDCPNETKYCDTNSEECQDCCGYTYQVDCPTPDCTEEASECRNVSGTPCQITIPEIKRPFRPYIFPLVALAVVTIITLAGKAGVRHFKKKRTGG